MIRAMGQGPRAPDRAASGAACCDTCGIADAGNPAMPEYLAHAMAGVTGPAVAPPAGFDYSAAGITYQGTTVASWLQLALGAYMLSR
jgi:cytochrome c2